MDFQESYGFTDPSLEQEGVEVQIGEDAFITVRRTNNKKFGDYLTALRKPHEQRIQRGTDRCTQLAAQPGIGEQTHHRGAQRGPERSADATGKLGGDEVLDAVADQPLNRRIVEDLHHQR